jgi:hypothetical protein
VLSGDIYDLTSLRDVEAQHVCAYNRWNSTVTDRGQHPTTVPKQGKGRRYAKGSNCLKMGPEPGEADCDYERRCRQHYSRT